MVIRLDHIQASQEPIFDGVIRTTSHADCVHLVLTAQDTADPLFSDSAAAQQLMTM